MIWGGFEGFGPCLGISHPTHPHLAKISQKNVFFTPSLIVNSFSKGNQSEIGPIWGGINICLKEVEVIVHKGMGGSRPNMTENGSFNTEVIP